MQFKNFIETKSEIKSNLKSNADKVMESLIKIYLYPDAQEQSIWKREVTKLYCVPKIKSERRYPSESFIYDHTWVANESKFDAYVDAIVDSREEDPIPCDVDTLYNACEEYFSWLSTELGKFSIISQEDSYSEVERIRNHYF